MWQQVVQRFGGNPKIKIIGTLIKDVAGIVAPGRFDFVYLDACHRRDIVLRDLKQFGRRLHLVMCWLDTTTRRQNGILGFR